jgi:hypothetical protein
MATKLAKSQEYLEYIIIRPTFGIAVERIADAILLYHAESITAFKAKYKSWNKIMQRFNYILLEEGLSRLDYAGESIDDYENKHKVMVAYLKSVNPLIGTKKGDK